MRVRLWSYRCSHYHHIGFYFLCYRHTGIIWVEVAMAINYKFGSFELDATNRDVLYFGDSDSRQIAKAKPLDIDESVIDEASLRGRKFTVRGAIFGSGSTLIRRIEEVKKALLDGKQNFYIESDRYLANSLCKSFKSTIAEGGQIANYTAIFESESAFKDANSASQDSEAVTSDHTWTITTTGDGYAYPTMTLTASEDQASATIKITNQTTGSALYLGPLSISNGDVLVFDCKARTITLNGTLIMQYLNIAHVFLTLASGANAMKYEGTNEPPGILVTNWRDTWL